MIPICTQLQSPNIYEALILTNLKEEIDSSTVINGDFYTQISIMYWVTREKFNKEIGDLNSTIKQLYPTDIYKTFHPIAKDTFFSQVHMEYSLGYNIC